MEFSHYSSFCNIARCSQASSEQSILPDLAGISSMLLIFAIDSQPQEGVSTLLYEYLCLSLLLA